MTVLKKDHTGLFTSSPTDSLRQLIILTLSHAVPQKESNEIEAPNISTVREIMRIRPNMQ